MALISAPVTVTIPSTSYVKVVEDRTSRITICTPKDAPVQIEVQRESRESRDGVLHEVKSRAHDIPLDFILAHPQGPGVMSAIASILDSYISSIMENNHV